MIDDFEKWKKLSENHLKLRFNNILKNENHLYWKKLSSSHKGTWT